MWSPSIHGFPGKNSHYCTEQRNGGEISHGFLLQEAYFLIANARETFNSNKAVYDKEPIIYWGTGNSTHASIAGQKSLQMATVDSHPQGKQKSFAVFPEVSSDGTAPGNRGGCWSWSGTRDSINVWWISKWSKNKMLLRSAEEEVEKNNKNIS